MVSKGRIAILIVLLIISTIGVGVSIIYLNRSYEKLLCANEKAKIACMDLRDSLDNVLRALRRVWQYPEVRSQAYVDDYNQRVDDFNNGSCPSYGLKQDPHFTDTG